MSYLVRIFDGDTLLECYGLGHDEEGMVVSAYGTAEFRPETVNPNQCDLSFWGP